MRCYFYPRSPCGERHQPGKPNKLTGLFLSTLSLRRATQNGCGQYYIHAQISIHALLAESDERKSYKRIRPERFLSTLSLRRATNAGCNCHNARLISIHALLAESDRGIRRYLGAREQFLSTLSLRRATQHQAILRQSRHRFLSTLSLRRATWHFGFLWSSRLRFLSTLSLRRATWPPVRDIIQWEDFYPRSPCGERHRTASRIAKQHFISIHALLAESDVMDTLKLASAMLFLSTLSLRRATAKVHKTVGHFCAYGTNFMGIASSC